MPICGRSPDACFKAFRDHLDQLISRVLGKSFHVALVRSQDDVSRCGVQLAPHGEDTVALVGRHGTFYFELRQIVEAVQLEKRQFQLKTRNYWYKVYGSKPTDQGPDAAMRWEYTWQVPGGKQWCRHHFQVGKVTLANGTRSSVKIPFGNSTLDLNRLHTPTSFVLVEYVLRFLVTDMGVAPASTDWEKALRDSERVFFDEFSPKPR